MLKLFLSITFVMLGVAPSSFLTIARCEDVPSKVSFTSEDVPIEFLFPNGWHKNPDKHPFDLQCLSPTENMNTGVFATKQLNPKTGLKPLDIFLKQVAGLKSKRTNIATLEEQSKLVLEGKRITFTSFSAERDGSSGCYRVSLIEFDDTESFAITIQVALPEEWDHNKSVLMEINRSANLNRHP